MGLLLRSFASTTAEKPLELDMFFNPVEKHNKNAFSGMQSVFLLIV